jgi:high affinity sulfate transporter 1
VKLRLPLLEWTSLYRREWLGLDVVAGLTAAAVVIPKALAYAVVAGLPIQVGLYTAFIPPLVYALLGSSRPLSVTTSTTLAILVAAQLDEAGVAHDPATLMHVTSLLALMVGVALIASSVLRLGFVANFISEPVLVGFKAGIGVVIVVDQIPKVLGIHFHKETFLHNVLAIFRELPNVSLPTLTVGVCTIAGLLIIERVRPRWPAPLIIIAAAIAAVAALALQRYGISLVGAVPTGLPTLSTPELRSAPYLWPGALGMALMSFTETIAAGRAFAKDDEPPIKPNVELFASGAANAVGAFFGSMPAGGGTSQTAVNRMSGARTQLASIVLAILSLFAMLFLSPLIALMPNAVLAGVVIVYSVGLIKIADFRNILRIRRTEFVWVIAAFMGVMLLGTLRGILVAIVVSLVALAQQTANPPVFVLGRKRGTNVFRPRSAEHSDDESFPGLLMLHLEGRLFFLNAERVAEKVRGLVNEARPRVVLFDLSGVFDIEYSALKMLMEAERRSREAQVELWLAGASPEVLAIIRRSPLGALLGRERLLFNVETAVAKYGAVEDSGGSQNRMTSPGVTSG